MALYLRKTASRAGGGTSDSKEQEETRISVMDFGPDQVEELTVKDVSECRPFRERDTVTWINVEGLEDRGAIEALGEVYGLHSLHVEDIVETRGRPKFEDYGEYILVVLKMLYLWNEDSEIVAEHVSLVLGKNYVISFQESRGDVFDNVRKLIRSGKGRVRREGPDYLAYLLIDSVVDNYFTVMDSIGEFVEDTEEAVLDKPDSGAIQDIHSLKNEMLFLRKAVLPLREVISGLQRGDTGLIRQTTEVHLRDVHDHIIQIMDMIDTYRDILSNMLDTYLSSLSNRMNEIMKVLTIFSTIFIPLTFLAGVYGMNFDHFPELHWRWSYPVFWLFCLLVAGAMLKVFRKMKWL